MFRVNNNQIINSGGSKTNETVRNLSRNLIYMPHIGAIEESNFLTSNIKKVFNYLQLTFIKALIL